MSSGKGVGIIGIGTYLPEQVRTNDYWSEADVAKWKERLEKMMPNASSAEGELTPGMKLSLAALDAVRSDPFQGSKSRRVLGAGETATDMAVKAAGQALSSAHRKADEIDLLLSHAMLPDYICVNGAAMIQSRIGLRENVPTFVVDAVCSSALAQLDLAKSMVQSGRAATCLLTQVGNTSPIMPMSQPLSAWAGDAASALVVGSVDEGLGVLSTSYRTDGSLHGGFVATGPDKRWFEEGHVTVRNIDRAAAKRMQLGAADGAKEVVEEALSKAGVEKKDVALFASHEPTAWLGGVCQERCGLEHAKRVTTFPWTGGIHSVCVPMQLAVAQREGMLKKGDVIVAFTPSAGQMLSAIVMRWAI